jgi:hypothetical protein
MKLPNISIANLAEVAAARAARPEVFRPTKVNGRWHMPKWSALAIARARKAAIMRGEPWEWDIPHKEVVKRVPFKGHKRDLVRIERAEEIARCMARMPAMVEEYRKSRKKKTKQSGILEAISVPRAPQVSNVVTKGAKRGNQGKA